MISYFSTGCTLLDLVIGGGKGMGYQAGTINNIVGDKSSGKSFLSSELIAVNNGKGIKFNYDDAECGHTLDTEHLYNMNIVSETRSKTVEELYFNCRKFFEGLKEGEQGIYVLDSLDALSDKAGQDRGDERIKAMEKGKDYDKGSYNMTKPKFLSQEFFPEIVPLVEKKQSLLLIVSQVRDNIGVLFGEKHTRSGGKALDFYSHTVVWLANADKYIEKERQVGVNIKARTKKNKTPRPYRSCFVNLLFDYGIDDLGTNIDYVADLLTDTGKIKKTINVEYDDQTFKRKTELIKYIEENGKESEWKALAIEQWEKIEAAIKSDRKKKYAEITKA